MEECMFRRGGREAVPSGGEGDGWKAGRQAVAGAMREGAGERNPRGSSACGKPKAPRAQNGGPVQLQVCWARVQAQGPAGAQWGTRGSWEVWNSSARG